MNCLKAWPGQGLSRWLIAVRTQIDWTFYNWDFCKKNLHKSWTLNVNCRMEQVMNLCDLAISARFSDWIEKELNDDIHKCWFDVYKRNLFVLIIYQWDLDSTMYSSFLLDFRWALNWNVDLGYVLPSNALYCGGTPRQWTEKHKYFISQCCVNGRNTTSQRDCLIEWCRQI